MIARYNRHGFFSEYFTTRQGRIAFLDDLARHPCWGDPAYTYSDLERIVRLRIRNSNITDFHHRLLAQDTARAERAEYDRLRRKFGDGQIATFDHTTSLDPAASSIARTVADARTAASIAVQQPRQADLFAFLE